MPRIIIQAGHEGRTSGATGAPNEQTHNIYVANALAVRLRDKGFEVRRVTADPTSAQIAGDWDLFFAIHYDADLYGSGGGFLDRPKDDGAAERSKAILEAIESEYFATTGIVNKPSRRNKNTWNYYMWSKLSLKTPCVLIECGVGMHKPDDYNILQNNRNLEVEGLYKGILKAFNIKEDMPTIQVEASVYEMLVGKASQYDELVATGYVLKPEHDKLMAEKDQRIGQLEQQIASHVCPTTPTTANEWVINGKQVTTVEGNVTTTVNYTLRA